MRLWLLVLYLPFCFSSSCVKYKDAISCPSFDAIPPDSVNPIIVTTNCSDLAPELHGRAPKCSGAWGLFQPE